MSSSGSPPETFTTLIVPGEAKFDEAVAVTRAAGMAFLMVPFLCSAKKPESHYQRKWCATHQGTPEYRLPDRTRVDCLTDSHSVEVDFAYKWAEAIGQSLHYSRMTGKRAGILLILRNPSDDRLLKRLESLILHFSLPIDVFTLRE